MKTSELNGPALDWAVATALGYTRAVNSGVRWSEPAPWGYWKETEPDAFAPSTNWEQGGPIIEKERIGVCYYHEADGWEVPNWAAWRTDIDDRVQIMGETPLIAAMRCYVASKLGDTVEVPKELL